MHTVDRKRLGDLAYRVDRHLGKAVSQTVAAHHRRRLRRYGWEEALAANGGGWARGTPPHEGCSLEVLIDGAEALPHIAAELAYMIAGPGRTASPSTCQPRVSDSQAAGSSKLPCSLTASTVRDSWVTVET